MNTSSITFLWQFEDFVSLYCNDYFNGHTTLHVDDGSKVRDFTLDDANIIIDDLENNMYRLWTSGPDGKSEEKYIEIFSETMTDQIEYLNDISIQVKDIQTIVDYVENISNERGLNLVESLYYAYLATNDKKQKLNFFYLLMGAIKLNNNNNFNNNIDNNSSLYIYDLQRALMNPELANAFLSGSIKLYKFTGKFYEYQDTVFFDKEDVDLSFLDRDYLYRLDIIVNNQLINSYYTLNPTVDTAKQIWDRLYKIVESINNRLNGLRYLPLAYHKFDEETQLAISLLMDKNVDAHYLQQPRIGVDEEYITAHIEGANKYSDLDGVYFCITDVEGLASNQILFKKKVDNLIVDLPVQGNSIYDGCYYSFLIDSNKRIISPVTLFNINEDIEHDYIEATLKISQKQLLNFLYEEFEEEDVNKYYYLFTDCIGNSEVTLSNYLDRVIDRFVQSNFNEDFFDLIHYINVYRFSNQTHSNQNLLAYNDELAHRIIMPNDANKEYIMQAVKFKRGENYKYDYKLVNDNADYITYDDADYTVISIFEKDTAMHCGLITVNRVGFDYRINRWNISVSNKLDI